MTEQDVTTRYDGLLNDVKTKDFYKVDLKNRVNCYTCQKCGHITKTKDIHAGVTPFMIRCEECKSEAYSSFFKDISPNQTPTFEWYRPELNEVQELLKKGEEGLVDHILNGGLHRRPIKN